MHSISSARTSETGWAEGARDVINSFPAIFFGAHFHPLPIIRLLHLFRKPVLALQNQEIKKLEEHTTAAWVWANHWKTRWVWAKTAMGLGHILIIIINYPQRRILRPELMQFTSFEREPHDSPSMNMHVFRCTWISVFHKWNSKYLKRRRKN